MSRCGYILQSTRRADSKIASTYDSMGKFTTFYHVNANPRFPAFLVYVWCKFRVNYIRRCFRDVGDTCVFSLSILTGVNQKVLPVLSTETLLHIWLSTKYYGFRPSSTAVDTVS